MTPWCVPWSFVVVTRVIRRESGDIGEGPSWRTPIKIEATEGQITLCSENFPRIDPRGQWGREKEKERERERGRERERHSLIVGKMNKLLVILGFLAASATAVPTSVVNNVQLNRDLDCLEQENALFSCISVKTVSMLDRAARSSDIDIVDGVKFVRETPSEFQFHYSFY